MPTATLLRFPSTETKKYCGICRRPETVIDPRNGKLKRLAVDHDHVTGKTRGLLCQNCNHALGLAHDNPAILRKMADYIEASRGGVS